MPTSSYQWHGSSNQRRSRGSTRCAKRSASSTDQPRLASTARMNSDPAALRATSTRLASSSGVSPPTLNLQPAIPAWRYASISRPMSACALPWRSQRAQSTQAIASSSVFRSRVAWVSANSVSQIRSPSKMLRPVTRRASSSWIRRTISRPCSRLSPLYTSLTSPASVRMRVMTVQRLRTAYVLPPKFFVSGISIAIASTLWTRMVPCRPDPLAPSVRHDRGARDVALVLLNEGVVDRLERELVGDDLLPRVARERAVHEVERAAQMLGFVVREAEDLAVAEDDPRGVELGFPADIDVADLQIRPLGRRHPEPLVDHLRVADQLHDDVAAPAVRERLDSLHAGLRRRMLAQVDDLVGAEPPRQLEPLVHAVDDDHARRAHLARHRARVDAETARALDDDDLPGAEPGQVEAGVDLGVGAVHARRHLVGDLVGELEDRVVRSQVEVLDDASHVLVPGVERERPAHLRVVQLAPPVVEVRAAHVGERDLDEDRPRLRVRH